MLKKKLKVGDLVKIITGKKKNTVDYISKINGERVYLKENVRESNNKKTKKKRVFVPIHISNVMYWTEK